jgi:hypothetical protein
MEVPITENRRAVALIATEMSDATGEELTAALMKRSGIMTSRSAVPRALHRIGVRGYLISDNPAHGYQLNW